MCLNSAIVIEDLSRTGEGYVVRIVGEDMLGTENYMSLYYDDDHYRLNQWYKAPEGIIQIDAVSAYPAGFHVFRTLDHALAYKDGADDDEVILKVKWRNLLAEGNQRYDTIGQNNKVTHHVFPCFVVREIKHMKEVARSRRS